MTREESDANERRNEVCRACRHEPVRGDCGGFVCRACGCRFAAVLFPVLAPRVALDPDEYGDCCNPTPNPKCIGADTFADL